MIDFSFPSDVEEIRLKVRSFMDGEVRPMWDSVDQKDRKQVIEVIVQLRERARTEWHLWLPHMPVEWGGMGLGPTAMAAVSAEAAKVSIGPYVLNAQAPDEGNQHTLLHWATPEQKQKYLRPLCEGTARSCFAMTEPEVAGSDPTLIKTNAYKDGDEWVINGHKWFISGARGAQFALLVARTEEDSDLPQAANSCFIVDIPSVGWNIVRDIETMSGGYNHCEILIQDLRVPASNMLGGRGQGHLLGQYRLGPARLAHCMRWIGQAETALDMMVSRALERYSHGSYLAEKQGIQWLIADSAMEHLVTVPTRHWRECSNKPDGVDLPMAPMRFIKCESLNEQLPRTRTTEPPRKPQETCHYEKSNHLWSFYAPGLEDGTRRDSQFNR